MFRLLGLLQRGSKGTVLRDQAGVIYSRSACWQVTSAYSYNRTSRGPTLITSRCFCGLRHFSLTDPGKWTTLTFREQSGSGSLNWSCSSQWMWLITGQLATGTCANTGRRLGEQATQSESRYHSACYFPRNCFNDFPTSCFIFMSSVLSVYCRGLPASKNDQLCMPLNMYICAFVYSIGVHWYFSFSSQWFTKKIKAATFPYFLTASSDGVLTYVTCGWHPSWHHRKSPFLPLTVSQSIPSASSYRAYRGHFLLAPRSI